MLRAAHLPPGVSPALIALKLSLIPTLNLTYPSIIRKFSSFPSLHAFLPKTFLPGSPYPFSLSLKRFPHMVAQPCPKASFSYGGNSGSGREILVQHLLVKEDDLKLLLELQWRISGRVDLSDLVVEYSICPSKEDGGMLGRARKGQMVPEFEEVAFNAPLNKVVRCKKNNWMALVASYI